MAILWQLEDTGARSGSDNADGERTASASFKTLVDNPDIDEFEILNDPNTPQILDPYDVGNTFDDELLIRDRRLNQDVNPYLWHLQLEFSNRLKVSRDFIDFSFEDRKSALETDLDGARIANSADDPFDPPPEETEGFLVLTIKRTSYTGVSPQMLGQFKYKTNSRWWFGFAPRTAFMVDLRARDLQETEFKHAIEWKVAVGEVRNLTSPDPLGAGPFAQVLAWPFDKAFLDAGYRQLNPGGSYVNILDDNGREVGKPHPLNLSGAPLSRTALRAGVRHYKVFRTKDSADFNFWRMPAGVPGGFP